MDDAFHKAIRHSAASIKAKAIADGQDVANAALYGNYAISDTPLKDIYGSNLGRLKKIKETYDPRNVMGLAGGFKFWRIAYIPRTNFNQSTLVYAM